MKFLPIIQVVADVLILALILFYFFKRQEDRKRDKVIEIRAKEMLMLNKTMDALIKEAQKVTEDLMGALESKQATAKKLLLELEGRKEEVTKLLSEPLPQRPQPAAEAAALATPPTPSSNPEVKEEEDKYAEAARLAEEGVSPEEIARIVNLPRGEVELILDLKK